MFVWAEAWGWLDGGALWSAWVGAAVRWGASYKMECHLERWRCACARRASPVPVGASLCPHLPAPSDHAYPALPTVTRPCPCSRASQPDPLVRVVLDLVPASASSAEKQGKAVFSVYVWKSERGIPHRPFFRAPDSWDSGGFQVVGGVCILSTPGAQVGFRSSVWCVQVCDLVDSWNSTRDGVGAH